MSEQNAHAKDGRVSASPGSESSREVSHGDDIFKVFYETAPLLMGVAELDGDVTVAVHGNAAIANFLGVQPDELPGRTGLEIGHTPEQENMWVEAYRRCQREGRPVQVETEVGTSAGSRWIRATATFVGFGPTGRPRFTFVAEDITSQRHAEIQLSETAARSSLLNDVLGSLLAAASSADLFETLFPRVAAAVNADVYLNYLSDNENEVLLLQTSSGLSPEEIEQVRAVQYGQAICGRVALQRRGMHVSDIERATDDSTALVRGFGIKAYCCNPLIIADRFLGTLSFATKKRAQFSEGEQDLLRTVAQYVAIALDRLRTEKEKRTSEERLTIARAAARIGIHDWNIRTNQIEWDERVRELWGVGATEAISYDVFQAGVHPDDREATQKAVQLALDPNGSGLFRAIYRVIHRVTQRERWIEATGRVSFENGTATRLIGTVLDISEHKMAQEALRESDAQFRTITEAFSGLMWIYDVTTGNNVFVNQGFCEFVGREPAGLLGRAFYDVVHPDDMTALSPDFAEAVASGRTFEAEYRIRRHDGEWRWHLTRTVPHKDDRGASNLWIGTAVDITERKRAEEALRDANTMLEDADRRKNEFLAVLSHELRNPLGPIRNSLYLLARVPPGGAQVQRAHEVIGRQADQLARLVDDLLDLNRISTGKMQVRHEPFEIVELMRRTLEDHRALFLERRISFEGSWPVQPLWVCGDDARFAQAVGNLLQNAAKFTPENGQVRLSVTQGEDCAVVEVEDTGAGIDPALIGHIFDPFTQAERTLDRSSGGLGLGLAILSGIVKHHNGTVTAESDGPGLGARFAIRVPLIRCPEPAIAEPLSADGAGRPRSVLIIEDNVDAAESLRDLLTLLGHNVQIALSGHDGLECFRRRAPEIVLCDIGLPGFDGYELARKIRSLEKGESCARLVALTGYGMDEDRNRALDAGFDEHLIKPVDPDRVQALLRDLD